MLQAHLCHRRRTDGFAEALSRIQGRTRNQLPLYNSDADAGDDLLPQGLLGEGISAENLGGGGNDLGRNSSASIVETAKDFCEKFSVSSESCKVFVNNIDFKVRQRELWDFFEYFGKVLRVHLVQDKKTKRSKGFAFVVFSSPLCAKKALNAKKYELRLNGRLMQVLPAVKKKKNKTSTYGPNEAEQDLKEAAHYFLNNALVEDSSKNVDLPDRSDLINELLCDNLLLEIFSYSDVRSRVQLELVCKRWHRVAILSWTYVKSLHFQNVFQLDFTHASLTDRILISILRKGCENLRVLDLSASPYLVTHASLLKVANVCQNLEELNLSFVSVNNKSAKEIGRRLKNLKKIYLSNCQHIGEKGFWWLFKDQVRLEVLQITDTPRLIGKCIYMLPSTITYVDFNSCFVLADLGVINLSNCCPNISYVDISFCPNITDDGLNFLFDKCSKIHTLKLKQLGKNVSCLRNIMKLKNLKDLDISRNHSVNDEVIRSVALECEQIQSINIEACHGDISSDGIHKLCVCRNLRELNLSYIVSVTDECVSELAMEGKLRKLLLRSCPEVSDNAAIQCLQFLDHLEVLDFSGCFNVTDDFPFNLNMETVYRTTTTSIELVLGGTQVTEEGKNILQKKMNNCTVTMQNFNVGMLRNDRDPTLVRPFFPESDESEDEEEIKPDLIILKPDVEFDMKEEYSCFDEDGERLWEICLPNPDSHTENYQESSEITHAEPTLDEDIKFGSDREEEN